MNYLSGVLSNVSRFAASINPATLSGAIDIVFVEQSDGNFKSTPFYVRFGKIGAIKSREKEVYIEINDVEISRTMILDNYGVAHFTHGQDEGQTETDAQSHGHLEIRPDRSRHKSEPSDITEKEETPGSIATEETLMSSDICPGNRAISNPDLHIVESLVDEHQENNVLILTRSELVDFNLKMGTNRAVFSITTQFQGTTRCSCNIFVWTQEDRIIISDIDGTITRSDVRGMILPMIGVASWAQEEVTGLYTKISANGYKILYLSARSISQAGPTRDYLRDLQQGRLRLPEGPLFLNPESALRAFKKEVIDRTPEVFKIKCLQNLRSLFTSPTPFFAGYGNRPNDVTAYEAVGIPTARIFIINKSGELRGPGCESHQTSYRNQSSIVDFYFPPVSQILDQTENGFWSIPLPTVELEPPS